MDGRESADAQMIGVRVVGESKFVAAGFIPDIERWIGGAQFRKAKVTLRPQMIMFMTPQSAAAPGSDISV